MSSRGPLDADTLLSGDEPGQALAHRAITTISGPGF